MYHEFHRHNSKQNRESLQISHQQGLNEQLQEPNPSLRQEPSPSSSSHGGREPRQGAPKTSAANPTTPQPFPEPRNNNSGGGDEAPGTRDWVCRRPTRTRPSGPAGPSPLLPKRLNYSAATIVQRGVWVGPPR
jgi:hypothetical protein